MRNLVGFALFSFLREVKDSGEQCDLLCDSEWTLLCLRTVFPEAESKTRLLPFVAVIKESKVIDCVPYLPADSGAWYNRIHLVRCMTKYERTM